MWYKAGFIFLFSITFIAVVFGIEWWPLSNYPMYGGKRDFKALSIYTWKVTDAKGVTTTIPYRRLPVLSSFSMSLEEMQEAHVDRDTRAQFIDRYIDSELQILGIQPLASTVAVYDYEVTTDMNGECHTKMAKPDLCIKERLVFKKNANSEIYLR